MDTILSARIDEAVARRIDSLARRLHTSKKKIIESAVQLYAAKVDRDQDFDVFVQTCGAWKREGSAQQTVDNARNAFRTSMTRRQR